MHADGTLDDTRNYNPVAVPADIVRQLASPTPTPRRY